VTDPTGRSFLSYRRTRVEDARLLIEMQHDLGVPTWQDLSDLGQGHTDAQLRDALADSETANALAYLTPDVKDSATITRTELPGIVKRTEAKDGFFVVPAAAGGLDYPDISATVGTYLGTHDLGDWNVTKVRSDPLSELDAFELAKRVLKHRLMTIHANCPADAPLTIGLHTRAAPPFSAGTTLNLDWSHRFNEREAPTPIWENRLVPALKAVGDSIIRFAPGRSLLLNGLCALPAAVMLGTTFLATRGIRAAWQQYSAKRPTQDWDLGAPRETSGFEIDLQPANTAANDIAVLVSVASSVEPAFAASRPSLPLFRATLHIRRPGPLPHYLQSPGQAADVAALVVEGLRRARKEFQARGTVHLFLAVPAGLAFLIGQSLNTVGPVQTYEHLSSDAVGRYQAAVLLHP
jgi:hypothetical protein